MTKLERGTVIGIRTADSHEKRAVVVSNNVYNEVLPLVQVVPIVSWSEKKVKVTTNVEIRASEAAGLSEDGIADCLQARAVDLRRLGVRILGKIHPDASEHLNRALRLVFDLN